MTDLEFNYDQSRGTAIFAIYIVLIFSRFVYIYLFINIIHLIVSRFGHRSIDRKKLEDFRDICTKIEILSSLQFASKCNIDIALKYGYVICTKIECYIIL